MNSNVDYEVKEGDTLSEIIYAATGNSSAEAYQEVAKNNGIENPDLIMPGQNITFKATDYMTDEFKTEYRNDLAKESSKVMNEGASVIKDNSSSEKIANGISNETAQGVASVMAQGSDLAKESFEDSIGPVPREFGNNTDVTTAGASTAVAASSASVGAVANASTMGGSNFSTSGEYQICYPANVKGWNPKTSFLTFKVKENAGESFVQVNNCVKKCGQDIDGIVSSLKTLRKKMGDNTGTTSQIDKITTSLTSLKQDLINKNQELIAACNEVTQYIYENKASKSQEASKVAQTISLIDIYKG